MSPRSLRRRPPFATLVVPAATAALLFPPAPAAAQRQPGDAAPVPATAQRTGTLRGRVTTPTGLPLGDVLVVVRPADPAERLAPRGTSSDDAGRWSLPALPHGTWTVTVRRMGLATITRTVTLAGDAATLDLTLAEQATVVAPVVVSATRETQRRAEASAAIDVLDGAEVRLARAAHPAQVLKRVPGVYVSQLSGEGSSVAIRQPITTRPMYLYLEDGIPTRATGFFNHNALYEVNLPQAGGIEVLKGPGTALYGSDAIGGVVNVLTRPAPVGVGGEVSTEGGSFGYGRLLASVGGTRGSDGVRVDLNLTRMDGWRRDNGYDRQSATLRWDHFGANGVNARTVITGTLVDQNDALALDPAGFTARNPVNRSPLAFRNVQALRMSTAIERQTDRGSWSVTPYGRYNTLSLLPSWQLTFDPQTWDTRNGSFGVLLKGRRDVVVAGDGAARRVVVRALAGADLELSPGTFRADSLAMTCRNPGAAATWNCARRAGAPAELTPGATTAYLSATPTRRLYDYEATYRQASPWAQLEWAPARALKVDVGARYDVMGYAYDTKLAPTQTGRWRVPGDTTVTYARLNPKVGFTFEPSSRLAFFGSWREGFRAPQQSQLFQQGTALNTVGLRPVNVGAAELGVRGQLGARVLYQVAAYDMTIRDDILTFTRPDGLREARNAGKTRHRGLETSVTAMLVPQLRLDVAYSVADQRYVTYVPQAARAASGTQPATPEIRYDGLRLEGAPSQLGNALLTWSPRLLRGGRLAAEYTRTGRYVMGYEVDRATNQPTAPVFYRGYEVWNLHANAQVTRRVELFARAMNLLDRNYAETASFNANDPALPFTFVVGNPRMVYAGLRYAR